jgi:putative hemolysin
MHPTIIEISVLMLCIMLSAFFSGSESALLALKKSDLHRFSHSRIRNERSIYSLMQDPQKILITILTGNLFVNLALSMLSTKILLEAWPRYGHWISIAIVSPLVILLCEITPKMIALSAYEIVSRSVLPLLKVFHVILWPVRSQLLLLTNAMIKIFNLRLTHKKITKDELGLAVKLGEQHGVIGKNEGTFIKNVLRFSRKDASNIMFPRNSAVFLPYGTSINEAMRVFVESGVIRIPVYKDDMDHVVGMVDSRAMMPYFLGYRRAKNINRFIQDITFFPASRELHDLLNDFLTEGIQIAIVVDEYGGTAGVVTLNKILSELMGRDMTKWEDDSRHEIKRLDGGISVISGEMQIEDFNYFFRERLESSNADSIGGYIIEKLSTIPKRGQVLETDKYVLKVRYIKKNKIESVEVAKREKPEEPEP